MYAKEFHVDGIRFDMTKDCESDYLLKQIALELNHHAPNVFTIAMREKISLPLQDMKILRYLTKRLLTTLITK